MVSRRMMNDASKDSSRIFYQLHTTDFVIYECIPLKHEQPLDARFNWYSDVRE